MTTQEYLSELFKSYSLASLMSDKNGCRVLKLRNKQLGRDMVVRVFERPVSAYRKLCDIACDNLPKIYDVIDCSDGQVVFEEYIDGMTVAEAMEIKRYSLMGANKVMRSVCSALEVLHSLGIIHRDVKPENVMIEKSGRILLVDMGAAREMKKASRDTVIMGTVGYASPEQLGLSQTDERTDIYAAGVLLNVMLTGKHPTEQLAEGYMGKLVKKCTSINPDERYQSAKKLAKALL